MRPQAEAAGWLAQPFCLRQEFENKSHVKTTAAAHPAGRSQVPVLTVL